MKFRINNFRFQPHPEPVFILGNEKSGTTIIAASLAKASNNQVTLDIPGTWDPIQTQLERGEISMRSVINNNRFAFSKKIIKEPVLTFNYYRLKAIYPKSKYVLIVRDPRDNIQSILNRLNLPGNLTQLEEERIKELGLLWKTWNTVIYNQWLGIMQTHYIASMAARWNHILNFYFDNEEDIILIRYEDFLEDKVGTINQLLRKLEFSAINDISRFVDIQFQSKGDKTIKREVFFQKENLAKINSICQNNMIRIGYEE